MSASRTQELRDRKDRAAAPGGPGSLLGVDRAPMEADAATRHRRARARRSGKASLLAMAPPPQQAAPRVPNEPVKASVEPARAGHPALPRHVEPVGAPAAQGGLGGWIAGLFARQQRETDPFAELDTMPRTHPERAPATATPPPPRARAARTEHPAEQQPAQMQLDEAMRLARAAAAEGRTNEPQALRRGEGRVVGLRAALAMTVAGAAIGLALAWTMPQSYVASAELIADPRQGAGAGELSAQAAEAMVESQRRVLRSGMVLGAVVDRLNLAGDPEFAEGGGLLGGGLALLLGDGADGSASAGRGRIVAIERLSDRLTVDRDGSSYGLRLSASTSNAEKSALIANAVVQAFIEIQGGSMPADGGERLETMRRSLEEAERAVAAYRSEHGLVDAQGRLISDDEIVRLNEQLAAARARTIDLNARAASAREGSVDAIVTGSLPEQLASPVLADLRGQHGDLRQQAERLAVRLGPRHPERIAVDAQLRGLRQQIDEELRRTAGALQVELRRAVEQEQELASRLAQLRTRQGEIGSDQVGLRQLEREAAARRAAYEEQLARVHRAGGIEGAAAGGVRVISRAEPPLAASGLPAPAMTLAGGMAGLLGWFGLATIGRRRRDAATDEAPASTEADPAGVDGAGDPAATDQTEPDTSQEGAPTMYPYFSTSYPPAQDGPFDRHAAQPVQANRPVAQSYQPAPGQSYQHAPAQAPHPAHAQAYHPAPPPGFDAAPAQAHHAAPPPGFQAAPAHMAMSQPYHGQPGPQPMPQHPGWMAHPHAAAQPQPFAPPQQMVPAHAMMPAGPAPWGYAAAPVHAPQPAFAPMHAYPAPQPAAWGYQPPMPPQHAQPYQAAHGEASHAQARRHEPRHRDVYEDDRIDPRTEAAIDEIRQSLREFREAIQDFAEERQRRYGT